MRLVSVGFHKKFHETSCMRLCLDAGSASSRKAAPFLLDLAVSVLQFQGRCGGGVGLRMPAAGAASRSGRRTGRRRRDRALWGRGRSCSTGREQRKERKKIVGPIVGSPNRWPPNWGGGEIWKGYQNGSSFCSPCWRWNFCTRNPMLRGIMACRIAQLLIDV